MVQATWQYDPTSAASIQSLFDENFSKGLFDD